VIRLGEFIAVAHLGAEERTSMWKKLMPSAMLFSG
jgi:hypothetical protein